jgi:hypothetical protein
VRNYRKRRAQEKAQENKTHKLVIVVLHIWDSTRQNVGVSTSYNPMGLHGLLEG